MNNKLTQKEVYDKLYSEMLLRIVAKNMYPKGKVFDLCSREANIYAVKHTWEWFNNQEEFIEYLTF